MAKASEGSADFPAVRAAPPLNVADPGALNPTLNPKP